jgi:hypothetical protein
MRIRILLLIKVMRICDQWRAICSIVQAFHFEHLKLLKFDFNADPDPGFHSYADPDPGFHSNTDLDPDFHSNADPDPAS